MNDDILLNPFLRKLLEQFRSSDAHALLLSGPPGAGKGFLTRKLAEDIIGLRAERIFTSQAGLLICPENGSIGIDAIRELRHFLRLKTTGQHRVVLIEDAETMTIEAQNALLKILEEPPLDTKLLMTVNGEEALRPTIYSRVQHVVMRFPAKNKIIDHFKALGFDERKIASTYHLADGQIGLMRSLLSDDGDVLARQLELAKQIITSKTYDRLLLVDALSREKENLNSLLYALKQVCRAALAKSIEKGEKAQIKRWHERVQVVYDAEVFLALNPNNKLLLSTLMVNL